MVAGEEWKASGDLNSNPLVMASVSFILSTDVFTEDLL